MSQWELARPTIVTSSPEVKRAAARACADAALRGVFPIEELPEYLAMLDLDGTEKP